MQKEAINEVLKLTTDNTRALAEQAQVLGDFLEWKREQEDINLEMIGAVAGSSYIVGTIQPLLMKTVDTLEEMLQTISDVQNGIDALSSGTLTHTIISPDDLTCWLQHVSQIVSKEMPNYKVALPDLNTYYDMKLVSFVVHDYKLYINIPIFLQQELTTAYDLYRMQSIPMPVSAAGKQWKGTYTTIRLEKDYFATANKQALTMTAEDLHRCTRFGLTYYCLLYTSPSPRDLSTSRMPSSA